MRHTVTAGVDGSPESLAAAAWAAEEAELRGLPLTLVHAGGAPAPRTGLPEVDVPAGRHARALEVAVREVHATRPGLEIVRTAVPDPAGETLPEAARDAVLLALGSQGFSGFTGYLLGSVALDVAAHSTVPVVLVRGGRPVAARSDRPVLLGLDLDSADAELVRFAFDAASVRGAPLEVLYAWRPSPRRPHGRADAEPALPEDPGAGQEEALAAALRPWREEFPAVPVSLHLAAGSAAHRLVRASERAVLLVLGHREGAGERLGPVTHAAIHHAPCPLAVVPHGAGAAADRPGPPPGQGGPPDG
ncbi:universal stress protein [Streptomyces sanyensis]|uniref:universal stress protein n=1 Tax=Streptomyces sanyensis TaxID=568869 RepID=UPI003D789CF9